MRTLTAVFLVFCIWSGPVEAAPAVALLKGAVASTDRITSRGIWKVSGGALHATSNRHGPALWFPEAAAGVVTDGLVRMVTRVGIENEAMLFVRARYGLADLDHISGYRIAVSADGMILSRLDGGVLTELARTGRDIRTGGEVVTVELAGDAIRVSAAGMSLTATDRHHRTGRVGVGGTAATSLLEVDIGARATEMPPAERPQSGDRRLVVVSDDDVGRLTRAELDKRLFTPATEGRTVLVLDEPERQALLARGLEPAAIGGDLPWRAVEMPGTPRYPGPSEVAERLEANVQRYPGLARVERIGESSMRRPILALRISRATVPGHPRPSVLINGAHHGHELMSTLQVLDAIDTILAGYGRDPEMTRLVDAIDIVCVPLVNPDGTAAFLDWSGATGRKNGRDIDENGSIDPWDGVDLNRNYPFRFGSLGERASRSIPTHWFYRGPGPASEPETRAMMALAKSEHFVAALSFHTLSTVILTPYTIRGTRRPRPDDVAAIAEELVSALPEQPNGRRFKVVREIYAVDGTDQDWLFHTFGTAAFIIEGPLHNPTDVTSQKNAVVAQRPTWLALLRRVLSGPLLTGVVVDEMGRPVPAEVLIDDVTLGEGEKWTSRSQDGAFHRLVAGNGPRRLTVRADGFMPWGGTVRPGVPLEVVLRRDSKDSNQVQ